MQTSQHFLRACNIKHIGEKEYEAARPPRLFTAVPCTQMQAGIPAKRRKTPCTATPCSQRMTDEATINRESMCPVSFLSALPSASVSVIWIGFVLLLCQDVVGLNR